MNGDVLRVIYSHLVSAEGDKIYTKIIDEISSSNKNRLESIAQIIKA
jgi:hypothetical protein